MPTTEIITIINNSGKVISTGKQLVSIFKEAKAAYREKRETIKLERAGGAGIQRAHTFDATPRGNNSQAGRYYYEEEEDEIEDYEQEYIHERRAIRDRDRPRSQDDLHSQVSHRSYRSRRSERPDPAGRPALTIANLKTHSEVSSVSPSAPPGGGNGNGYRAPYAETAPHDMQLSRPNLAHAATMPLPPRSEAPTMTTALPLVHRPHSDFPPLSVVSALTPTKKKKEIDMNLAYGEIPPDLAERRDLDRPSQTVSRSLYGSGELVPTGGDDPHTSQALTMVDRIESLLEEAQCIHHTASSMIENLQQNPQAAAAVALTLAELSTLIGKMSPSFLIGLKGSSPAVLALLASPQFLIGTSVVVGVTVIMFGGWKIVKRIKDQAAQRAMEAPFEMQAMPSTGANTGERRIEGGGVGHGEYDEALVLEEELSTIESWRRGIQAFGVDADEESADIELMSREAEKHLKEKWKGESMDREVDPMDSVSQVGMRRERRERHRRRHRDKEGRSRIGEEEEVDVPERKSSRRYRDKEGDSEVAESVRSARSHRSGHSSSSKRSERTKIKAIEEGKEEGDEEGVVKKEKKNNMLKTLFRKMKEKEEGRVGEKKEGSKVGSKVGSTAGSKVGSKVGSTTGREGREGSKVGSRAVSVLV